MKKVTKVITFYDDGTFTEYTPSPYMPTTPMPWTAPQWPQNPWYTVTSSDKSTNDEK